MRDAAINLVLTDALQSSAETLLLMSTNPWELDAAMRAHGFTQGVCEAQDATGLDIDLARRRGSSETAGPARNPILPRMVAEGRLGRKVSVGWYRYPGGGGLVIDPLVEDLLREEAWFAGITRHEMQDAALVEYLITGVFIAGLRLLVASGGDKARINDASLYGLGLPSDWGGIFSYARDAGRGEMERRVARMAQFDGTDASLKAGCDLLFSE